MKLSDVRANRVLTEWWMGVMAHPNFKVVWQMMNENHPLRFPEVAQTTTPGSDRRLGYIEGYELALRRLELVASFEPGPEALPAPTFAPLETNEQNESPS